MALLQQAVEQAKDAERLALEQQLRLKNETIRALTIDLMSQDGETPIIDPLNEVAYCMLYWCQRAF